MHSPPVRFNKLAPSSRGSTTKEPSYKVGHAEIPGARPPAVLKRKRASSLRLSVHVLWWPWSLSKYLNCHFQNGFIGNGTCNSISSSSTYATFSDHFHSGLLFLFASSSACKSFVVLTTRLRDLQEKCVTCSQPTRSCVIALVLCWCSKV
eukprot:3560834-Amphidinium_carterae.1